MVSRQPVRAVSEIEKDIKRRDFEVYYRIVKVRTQMISGAKALLRANDKFMAENPDYVEGAICGKLKENK